MTDMNGNGHGEHVHDDVCASAAEAVALARADDLGAAVDMFNAIVGRHGPQVVGRLMLMLCDTVAANEGIPADIGGGTVALRFEPADGVAAGTLPPPEVQWAGQLIAARAARDKATYVALCGAVPEPQVGRYVACLLDTVAVTLNMLHGQEGP